MPTQVRKLEIKVTRDQPREKPVVRARKRGMDRQIYQCNKCGYIWVGRLFLESSGKPMKPARCASCNSTTWDRKVVSLTHNACGHSWKQKGARRPARCPGCRAYLHWGKSETKKDGDSA